MRFNFFILCFLFLFVGLFRAMEPDSTNQEQLQTLLKGVPTELKLPILIPHIERILREPFSKKIDKKKYIENFLSLISLFSKKDKKSYLNTFAKKWDLAFGQELQTIKEPNVPKWIKKQFPGKKIEQVLDYGFSVTELLEAKRIPTEVKIVFPNKKLMQVDLKCKRVNSLKGLKLIKRIDRARKLFLNDNQLHTIKKDAFDALPHLNDLYVGGNPLSKKTKEWLIEKFGENVSFHRIKTNAFGPL